MIVRLPASPRLAPYVEHLWASDGAPSETGAVRVEAALPSGQMHLAFRLSSRPIRILAGPDDREGQCFGAVISGARSAPYFREAVGGVASVGVQFRIGAAGALLGVPAGALAGRHTSLVDVVGAEANTLRERLWALERGAARITALCVWLERRLAVRFTPRSEVIFAAEALARNVAVERVVRESGLSHRRLIAIFSEQVGLAPKAFARVSRFQRALALVSTRRSWTELALDAGYADQSHLTREFSTLGRVTPGRYARLAPSHPSHVPVG